MFQKQYANISKAIRGDFTIDFTVGRNLVFRIDYTDKSYLKSFILTSPNGAVYSSLEYDEYAKVALFKIDHPVEVGEWDFTLRVTNSANDSIAVTVTTQTRSIRYAVPITAECYIPDGAVISNASSSPIRILAKVMQGFNPVLSAKVKAFIKRPNNQKIEELELFDNGAFADSTKNDGIYSRYFTSATSSGRYTVTCEISDDGQAFISSNGPAYSVVSLDSMFE